LALFCADLPLDISLRVIDFFLLDDYKIIFKVALALLKQLEEKILKLSHEDTLFYLRSFTNNFFIDEVYFYRRFSIK